VSNWKEGSSSRHRRQSAGHQPLAQLSQDVKITTSIPLKRFARYEEATRPVLDHYRVKGILHTVDGTGPPEETLELISGSIPEFRWLEPVSFLVLLRASYHPLCLTGRQGVAGREALVFAESPAPLPEA